MSANATVQPKLLRWARRRVSLTPDQLGAKMKVSPESVIGWERSGTIKLACLKSLAKKTHTPFGYFFLDKPPDDSLPIADLRTKPTGRTRRPNPDLLDTVYICQRRQAWYRHYLISEQAPPISFVGRVTISTEPEGLATHIRQTIGLNTEARASLHCWTEALTDMVRHIEDAGVLVMRSGIVGNNTHRKLDVDEFRGFALSDNYAPLIFVNADDAKAAQMFTLAHELTHIWLGQSGVSDIEINSDSRVERFCNAVAAELLVPMAEFRKHWDDVVDVKPQIQQLARYFKVSEIVLLIRAFKAGSLPYDQFHKLYDDELKAQRQNTGGTGSDFYNTQRSRLGRRFSEAVIASALTGRLTYTEAFRLLGVRSEKVLDNMAKRLGVIA